MTSNPFPILVERFFTEHLRTQRNVSPLTIEAYSDTFRSQRILTIPCKRTTKPVLTFMNREEVAAVVTAKAGPE